MSESKRMSRRSFVRLCLGTGALVATEPALLAEPREAPTSAQRVTLVSPVGDPLKPADLKIGESYVFHYPYVSTPVFLINLGKPAKPGEELETEDGRIYRWRGGVGPDQSIVAFSAICAHKMSYPTRTVSFINYRHDNARFNDLDRNTAEREQVIYCCSEGSVYDPAAGGRVLGGPAPQPLTAIDLDCDTDDVLCAVGTYGGELYERFFEGFGFQLALERGTDDIRAPATGTATVWSIADYTSNRRTC
jgi:arsenite oxidase small subunit